MRALYMRKNKKKYKKNPVFFKKVLLPASNFADIFTFSESPWQSASIDTPIVTADIDGGGATSGQMSIFTIFRRKWPH